MEVIWLPINRADRGKMLGQRTTVLIMQKTQVTWENKIKAVEVSDCLVTAATEVNISEEWHKKHAIDISRFGKASMTPLIKSNILM